jgi:hypothetical protein
LAFAGKDRAGSILLHRQQVRQIEGTAEQRQSPRRQRFAPRDAVTGLSWASEDANCGHHASFAAELAWRLDGRLHQASVILRNEGWSVKLTSRLRASPISLSLHSCLFPETVTKDANIHLRVVEAMSASPVHEILLKHGEQAGRDFLERFGFRNDFLSANKFIRKIDVEG